jgi:hypothetical protein
LIMKSMQNLTVAKHHGTMKSQLAASISDPQLNGHDSSNSSSLNSSYDGSNALSPASVNGQQHAHAPERPVRPPMLKDKSALHLVARSAGTFNREQAQFLTDLAAKKAEASNSFNRNNIQATTNPHQESPSGSSKGSTFKIRQVVRRMRLQKDTFDTDQDMNNHTTNNTTG